jgi:predicted nucleic acid-binding protein
LRKPAVRERWLYLELAHRRGLPLATADRALRAAARALRVDLTVT